MISLTAEYALRAMICLEREPQRPLTTQEIADKSHVPVDYLHRVLRVLGKAGLLNSRRGLHGGYVLASGPGELTVLDVINAIGGIPHLEHCPLNLPSHDKQLCPLHQRVRDAVLKAEKSLGDTRLHELLGESQCLPRHCRPSNSSPDVSRTSSSL